MSKRKVSLYLGVDSIGGVVVDKGKIVSLAHYNLASLEEESKVENLNEDVKWEALINRTLRDMAAEEKEVYISLADKDFIFRSFEMPLMRPKELEVSVSYEIEKYIPFKLEQLRWDFSYQAFPKEKKDLISFLGIREANFQRVYDILHRLDLETIVVEPSSLSLARMVKTSREQAKVKNFAILDFSDSEAYLTFFYNDLPVFNRYFAAPKAEDGQLDVDKFVEPVRLSFQYFKRELKAYSIDKLIVIANERNERLGSMLKEELQMPVDLLIPYDFLGKAEGNVENLKAFGVSTTETSAYKFKPDFLISSEQKIGQIGAVKEVPFNIGAIVSIIAIGAAVLVPMSMFLNKKVKLAQEEATQQESQLVMPDELHQLSWSQIEDKISQRNKGVKALGAINLTSQKINDFIGKVPGLLPDGLWFENMEIVLAGGKYHGVISGAIFLGDDFKERGTIDKFIAKLSRQENNGGLFSKVELGSSERKDQNGYTVTVFNINME